MFDVNSKEIIQFVNCSLLRSHEIILDDLWVRNGKILNPEKIFFDEKLTASKKIDCQGALIAPGYIDVQINGGFGTDFSYDVDTVDKGLANVAKHILAHGVTSFCPTLVTSSSEVYRKVLPKIKKNPGGIKGATVLGVHLEGPFINPDKRGAHNADEMKKFENGFLSLLDVYGSLENTSIVTLAPEIPNAMEVISKLVEKGITVSVGHSTADIKIGEEAAGKGARLITHLFNAMLPFHHRDPGLVGLLTTNNAPRLFYGIIADGVHTHPASLRIAHRAHPDGVVLVTDAISAMGLAEGTHHLGQLFIEVKQNKAYISGTSTLCGSIDSMDMCVRFFKDASSCSLVEALEAASLHPAQALGISRHKGTLNFDADADFILLGKDLDVWSTWIAGECVYQNKEKPAVRVKQVA